MELKEGPEGMKEFRRRSRERRNENLTVTYKPAGLFRSQTVPPLSLSPSSDLLNEASFPGNHGHRNPTLSEARKNKELKDILKFFIVFQSRQ